jgi:outer membrane protein TolC
LDRQIERLGVRQATIALTQSERDYEKFRDQIGVDVRQAVRNIDLSRFQLKLAEDQVRINERRLKELELKAAEVDTQKQLDAADNLQQSKDALAQAQTDLRNAVLNYLKTSGLLRVARDGTLLRLPGMENPDAPEQSGPKS